MNREDLLVEEYMILLQTQNGDKVIVDTRPALQAQLDKAVPIMEKEYGTLIFRILVKAGVANSTAEPNVAEIIMAAEEYLESSKTSEEKNE